MVTSDTTQPVLQVSTYQYVPLDTKHNQIRLLKFDKDSTFELYNQYILSNFDLDKAPPYSALSYRWNDPQHEQPTTADGMPALLETNGTSTKACHIIVKGLVQTTTSDKASHEDVAEDIILRHGTLSISENLWDFLQTMQQSPKAEGELNDDNGWLWIDQLSIDQTNLLERNQQVGLMSAIYRRCYQVIIWLGKHPETIAAAQRLQSLTGSWSPSSRGGWFVHSEGGTRHGQPDYNDLLVLLTNSYFRRVWIVQEILLPRYKRILCGTTWLDWFRLASPTARLIFPEICQFEDSGVPLHVIKLMREMEDGGWHERQSLAILLGDFYGRECEDPRDKVYGLLGLVDKGPLPTIDYTKSLDQVWYDTAVATCSAPFNVGDGSMALHQLAQQFGLVEQIHINDVGETALYKFLLAVERVVLEKFPYRSDRRVVAMKPLMFNNEPRTAAEAEGWCDFVCNGRSLKMSYDGQTNTSKLSTDA